MLSSVPELEDGSSDSVRKQQGEVEFRDVPFAYPDASWAAVKPAKILIFDNSASALDLKKAISLYGALQESYPDATKLIVTQRIASTRHADRIVMLKNGQIAAAGTRFTSQ